MCAGARYQFAVVDNDQRFRSFQTSDQRIDRSDALFALYIDCLSDCIDN